MRDTGLIIIFFPPTESAYYGNGPLGTPKRIPVRTFQALKLAGWVAKRNFKQVIYTQDEFWAISKAGLSIIGEKNGKESLQHKT